MHRYLAKAWFGTVGSMWCRELVGPLVSGNGAEPIGSMLRSLCQLNMCTKWCTCIYLLWSEVKLQDSWWFQRSLLLGLSEETPSPALPPCSDWGYQLCTYLKGSLGYTQLMTETSKRQVMMKETINQETKGGESECSQRDGSQRSVCRRPSEYSLGLRCIVRVLNDPHREQFYFCSWRVPWLACALEHVWASIQWQFETLLLLMLVLWVAVLVLVLLVVRGRLLENPLSGMGRNLWKCSRIRGLSHLNHVEKSISISHQWKMVQEQENQGEE